MKYAPTTTPKLADAKQATGKTPEQWFKTLDDAGGVAKGRKGLSDLLFKEMKVDAWWTTTLVVEYEKARGAKEKDGRPTGYSICATKSVAAPAAAVYAAWCDPKHLSRWFGDGAKADVKDGGTFSTADGERGEYVRVRENKDLRFRFESAKHGPNTLVDVAFKETGGKTGITLNHTRIESRADADALRAAWGGAFDRLKTMLEGS